MWLLWKIRLLNSQLHRTLLKQTTDGIQEAQSELRDTQSEISTSHVELRSSQTELRHSVERHDLQLVKNHDQCLRASEDMRRYSDDKSDTLKNAMGVLVTNLETRVDKLSQQMVSIPPPVTPESLNSLIEAAVQKYMADVSPQPSKRPAADDPLSDVPSPKRLRTDLMLQEGGPSAEVTEIAAADFQSRKPKLHYKIPPELPVSGLYAFLELPDEADRSTGFDIPFRVKDIKRILSNDDLDLRDISQFVYALKSAIHYHPEIYREAATTEVFYCTSFNNPPNGAQFTELAMGKNPDFRPWTELTHLLFPFRIGSHFVLFRVDLQKRQFLVLDPLVSTFTHERKYFAQQFRGRLSMFLTKVNYYRDYHGDPDKALDLLFLQRHELPQQPDSHSCGAYICYFLTQLCKRPPPFWESHRIRAMSTTKAATAYRQTVASMLYGYSAPTPWFYEDDV